MSVSKPLGYCTLMPASETGGFPWVSTCDFARGLGTPSQTDFDAVRGRWGWSGCLGSMRHVTHTHCVRRSAIGREGGTSGGPGRGRLMPTAGWRQTNSSFFQIWPGSNLKKTKMLPDFLASPPDVIRGLRCPLSSRRKPLFARCPKVAEGVEELGAIENHATFDKANLVCGHNDSM